MSGVRTAVRRMKPYVPGKPVEDVQRELGLHDLVKLNQNENPLGPSPRAVAAAQAAMAAGSHLSGGDRPPAPGAAGAECGTCLRTGS